MLNPMASMFLRFAVTLSLAYNVASCGSDHKANSNQDYHEENYVYDPSRPDYSLPESAVEDGLEFLKAGNSAAGLVKKVNKPELKVCYFDSYNSSSMKETVKSSILKWIDALRGISNNVITSTITLQAWNTQGCDVKVTVGNYNPASTSMGSVPTVRIANSGWYGSSTVVLHEFGHAFGLLDTYNGRGGSCQPGQPTSVMCYAKFNELMADDVEGVRSVYRSVYGQ